MAITYPIAGWFGAKFGLHITFWVLGVVATLSILLAAYVWPRHDNKELEHGHSDLPEDHPHLIQHHVQQGKHVHAYIIDDLHQRWPK